MKEIEFAEESAALEECQQVRLEEFQDVLTKVGKAIGREILCKEKGI